MTEPTEAGLSPMLLIQDWSIFGTGGIRPLRHGVHNMTVDNFRQSLTATEPPAKLKPCAHRTMVGCQGRLEAGALIGSAGRRPRGFVGTRLPASQRRRSEQRSLLVWSGGQASLPGAAGCRMAKHRQSVGGITRALLTYFTLTPKSQANPVICLRNSGEEA
jgi:hypothetical protein